jgi:hypothetical protein
MINGNIKALLQEKKEIGINVIGERIQEWVTIIELKGFLDFQGQSTNRTTYETKLEESSHLFICDYKKLDKKIENKRLVVENEVYDVLLIDDPMNLHQHLEIYLKYVGGK